MIGLAFLTLFSLSLTAWETPWSNVTSDSDLNTPWGAQISEARAEAREDFFQKLEEPSIENPEKLGIPEVADDDATGAEALSQLPWTRFESKGESLRFSQSLVWPVAKGRISSGFGVRGSGFHEGVDIPAPAGTGIRAVAEGRVVFSGSISGYGKTIVVYHGQGVSSVYAHNSKNLKEVGDRVMKGQLLGYVGQTGRAQGPHLHFEMRRQGKAVNPLLFFKDS